FRFHVLDSRLRGNDGCRCPTVFIVDEQKSGQGDEAADSTNSTEPIHSVLQHLRESFSLS
ncbi:hypothetical protein, partial [Neisseria meningitidis]|uniref:hypothetical protein n=1 Tax=Neisseria meningitidis TaxID=487 RepID=UPI003D2E4415